MPHELWRWVQLATVCHVVSGTKLTDSWSPSTNVDGFNHVANQLIIYLVTYPNMYLMLLYTSKYYYVQDFVSQCFPNLYIYTHTYNYMMSIYILGGAKLDFSNKSHEFRGCETDLKSPAHLEFCWSCCGRLVVEPGKTSSKNFNIHPGRSTWTIIMEVWKIIFLSKWVICRFHVNLPGCTFNHQPTIGSKKPLKTPKPTNIWGWRGRDSNVVVEVMKKYVGKSIGWKHSFSADH